MFIEVKGEFDFGRSMVRSEVETRMISVNELRVVKLFFFPFLLLCLFCFNDAGHFLCLPHVDIYTFFFFCIQAYTKCSLCSYLSYHQHIPNISHLTEDIFGS